MNIYRYSWELSGQEVAIYEADKPGCLARFDSEVDAMAWMQQRHPDAKIDLTPLFNEGLVVEFPPFESEGIVW